MHIEKDEKITTIAKIVEYVKFNDIFAIYKITTKINEIGSYKFGICLNEEIERLKSNPDYFKSKVDNFKIFHKSALEEMKNNSVNFSSRYKEFTYSVPEMLNLAKELNNLSDFIIAKYNDEKIEITEYDQSIPHPKSIHFNYPQITSKEYDIEKVVEKLKLRKDLEILENDSGELIHNRNGEKFIRCIWKPSKYTWNIVYEEKLKHYNFNMHNFIKETVFNI